MPTITDLANKIATVANRPENDARRYIRVLVRDGVLPKHRGKSLTEATPEHAAILLIAFAATDRPDIDATEKVRAFGALRFRRHGDGATFLSELTKAICIAQRLTVMDHMAGVGSTVYVDRNNMIAEIVSQDRDVTALNQQMAQGEMHPDGFAQVTRTRIFAKPLSDLAAIERYGREFMEISTLGRISKYMIRAAADCLSGLDQVDIADRVKVERIRDEPAE